MSESAENIALSHATKHFEIHAAQRLTAFNFFIVISGAILAAIAASIQRPNEFALPGAALSALLVILSAVFWKLDSRTKFLIKHSEAAIKNYEREHLDPKFRVFSNEELETDEHRKRHKFIRRMFSYTEVFGLLFFGSGLLGIVGAIALTFSPQILSTKSQEPIENIEKLDPITKEAGTTGASEETTVLDTSDPPVSDQSTTQTSKDVDPAGEHQQSGS